MDTASNRFHLIPCAALTGARSPAQQADRLARPPLIRQGADLLP